MKIRIDGQKVNFRISKAALKQLLDEGILAETLYLPNGYAQQYSIIIAETTVRMSLDYQSQNMQLSINSSALNQLALQNDQYDGITIKQKLDDGRAIDISLEIDAHRKRKAK